VEGDREGGGGVREPGVSFFWNPVQLKGEEDER
jgi:hypothetical protein